MIIIIISIYDKWAEGSRSQLESAPRHQRLRCLHYYWIQNLDCYCILNWFSQNNNKNYLLFLQLHLTSAIVKEFADLIFAVERRLKSSSKSWIEFSYCIALIFRGSKFPRIAVFDNFVEKFSRIRCTITRSRRWCKVSKFPLKYFREWHRICENRKNLDPQNISAIRSS